MNSRPVSIVPTDWLVSNSHQVYRKKAIFFLLQGGKHKHRKALV